MAVELMVGAYTTRSTDHFASRMEENAVREATSAGLQSVEKLIKLLSQNHSLQNNNSQLQDHNICNNNTQEYKQVADLAVNKFKKVISLLDRTRTGHARFRRGPITCKGETYATLPLSTSDASTTVLDKKPRHGSAFTRVYTTTTPSQIQRLPPLPHSNNAVPYTHHSSKAIERKDSSTTTINFSSYVSSLTGDSESGQPSLSSSGFQITNVSQVSSVGKPPLSSSFKRKCNSVDDSKCSGPCHCPKRRYFYF